MAGLVLLINLTLCISLDCGWNYTEKPQLPVDLNPGLRGGCSWGQLGLARMGHLLIGGWLVV